MPLSQEILQMVIPGQKQWACWTKGRCHYTQFINQLAFTVSEKTVSENAAHPEDT